MIEIYIGDKCLELTGNEKFLLNFKQEDFNNPTVILTHYSKTIAVQGTAVNNQIFGHYWHNDRINVDGLFNPSLRVNAYIINAGNIISDGYVKLDTISINSGQPTYNLTYYGGVADIFYKLHYDENGNGRSLGSLDFGTDISLDISKEAIAEAWARLQGDDGADAKYDIINFAPMNNGLPEDFSADKAIINFWQNSTFTATTIDDYHTYKNTYYSIATLPKEVNEWEIRDLRSYLQRPVLSVKGLFTGISNAIAAEGYELDLDRGFFNDVNPYYANAWITLPLLSNLESIGGGSIHGEQEAKAITIADTAAMSNFSFTGDISGTIIEAPESKGTFSFHTDISLKAQMPWNMGTYLYLAKNTVCDYIWLPEYPQDFWHTSWRSDTQYDDGGIALQLVAVDTDTNLPIATSPVYTFTNVQEGHVFSMGSPVNLENTRNIIDGRFVNDGNGNGGFTFMSGGASQFTLALDDIPRRDHVQIRIAFKMHTKKLYFLNADYFYYDLYEENGLQVMVINDEKSRIGATYTDFTMTGNASGGEIGYTEYDRVNSYTHIEQQKLFQGEQTPCDYLLSYTKLFGLQWVKEVGKNIIHLYTRNRFYDGDLINLDGLVDLTRQTITPIAFNTKYYDLQLETEESKYYKLYKDSYNTDYGKQRINTNYNFNSEATQVYENSVFKGGIFAKCESPLFKHFKHPDWTEESPVWYNSAIYGGVEYNLYKGLTAEDSTGVTLTMAQSKYINYGPTAGLDCQARMCFADAEGNAVDGSNVLVMFDGFREQQDIDGNPITYWLTDDLDLMLELNDDTPCWLFTDSQVDLAGESIATAKTSLPCFSRYATEGENMLYSLDFGQVQELYNDLKQSDNTVYKLFWQKYLQSQLDVNTRLLQTSVVFQKGISESLFRKTYWFDGCYWILNEISDWQVGDCKATCTFIKVKDRLAYEDGQELIYPQGAVLAFEHDLIEVAEPAGTTANVIIRENVEDVKPINTGRWFRSAVPQRTQLDIEYDSNYDTIRNTFITIEGYDYGGKRLTATMQLKQAGAPLPYISVNPSSLAFAASGETKTVEVISSHEWNASGIQSFLTMSPQQGNAGTTTVTIVCASNEGGERGGTITFTNVKGSRANLTHEQAAAPAYLEVEPLVINAGVEGGVYTLDVSSNIDWVVEGVWPPTNNKIYYTSTDGNIVTPDSAAIWTNADGERITIVNNTYNIFLDWGCIEFSDNIAAIPNNAFGTSLTLASIDLPEGITSIGDYAFGSCHELTSITIPNSVESIGYQAFGWCEHLTTIDLPEGIASIGERAFESCGLTSMTIPDSVTSIGEGAFSASTISAITIGNGVARIENKVFSHSRLAAIDLPDNIVSIGDNAFENCTYLTSVTFGNGIESIGTKAFYYCTGLTSVNLISVKHIGDYAFQDCANLTSIVLGNNVESIGYAAFLNDYHLNLIYCHAAVAPSLDRYPFYEISSTGTLHYPQGSDYSTWITALPSGWAAVADL